MSKLVRGLFAAAVFTVLIGGAITIATEARAACRMMPECWVNSDCDAQCGIGQGRCVHSNCPVRVCKCR